MLAALAIALGLCLTRGHASIILSPVISATTIISNTPPVDASQPVAEAFISFAIEFGHFPDYAGMANLSDKSSIPLTPLKETVPLLTPSRTPSLTISPT